jgi:hypothetical protein
MPLDPNIILQGQPVQIASPLDMMTKAMSLKNLAQQSQATERELADQQAMRDAYRKNMTVGADGTPTLNRQGFMSSLASQNPMLAMQKGRELQTQDVQTQEQKLALLKKQTDTAHELAMSITPDNWSEIRQKSIELGLPNAEKMPTQYPGDGVVQKMQYATMSLKDQLDQKWKELGYNQKERELGIKHQEVAIKRDASDVAKDEKAAKDLEKHLSQGWAGRSGQAGVVQGKINSAEAAEQLISQGRTQPGGLDSRQVEELAQSTARLLGGSAAASARVEALVPHTLFGRAQTLKEWLSNKPTGQDMQAFTERMAETVAREKALAQNQMRQYQVEGLPAHSALKKKNPELYNQILQAKGIDPSMIDEKGRYKAPAGSGGVVMMRDPQGNVRQVPSDQVEAAKAAGGTPL